MKLTNNDRRLIAKAYIDHTFGSRLDLLNQEADKLLVLLRDTALDRLGVKEQFLALPEYFFSTYASARYKVGEKGYSHDAVTAIPMWAPFYLSGETDFYSNDPLAIALLDHRERKRVLSDEIRIADRDLLAALNQFQTDKALLKAWPEGFQFMSHMNIGGSSNTLPAVVFDKFNELANLSNAA